MLPTPVPLPAVANLARAEAEAIQALAEYLSTDEGRAAGDNDIKLWLTDRGWPPSKWRQWGERIAAQLALADPSASDPGVLAARINTRFERLAFKAESNNDLKHAIAATEAQAKLHKLGGFAPTSGANVAIQINQSTAHLASDEDLLRIAQVAPVEDPLLA